ncbi:MAG: molecular chaperone HtpG, partial [Candidatus Fimimonas sp.]
MKKFKTESQKVLDIMINSIYTNKEIFLRELISNASDALDKLAYQSLTDGSGLDRNSLEIKISADKTARTLTISDNGVGMTAEELETNLGTIAKSGSEAFKKSLDNAADVDIIGQFGVGFYSAFMVADKVTVVSQKEGETVAHKWQSSGAAGYEISQTESAGRGTTIVLQLKADGENENYSQYLEEYTLRSLVKKYSDYIRYPIKLWCTVEEECDCDERDHECDCDDHECEEHHHEHKQTQQWQTINSMLPLWKKPKSEISAEQYDGFYMDNFFDYEKPLKVIHTSAEGTVEYKALLFVPSHAPYNYYNKNYEKGLKLYTNGVLITEKCADLLPDCFSFVKGLVDSELTLNISRETIQQNRQLKLIANNLEKKITSELLSLQNSDRENYEKFWQAFGLQIKFGVYENWGAKKEQLKDLLLFRSVNADKLVTLKEYVENMAEGQTDIYYVAGRNLDSVKTLPQVEKVLAKGFDVLCLTDDVDEFALKVMEKYDEKTFKSVSDESVAQSQDENADLSAFIKESLGDSVAKVKCCKNSGHAVCLTTEGDLSIEMEKVLNAMPNAQNKVSAQKVLEISTEHPVYQKLVQWLESDKEKLVLAAKVL